MPEPRDLADAALSARMGKAVEAAVKAQESLRAADWSQVFDDLRGVWEALRDYNDVETLLRADGYTGA